MEFLVDMYGIRAPAKGELAFFKDRPEVAGMATEDNKITLNPYSTLSKKELSSVAQNEALRIFMRLNDIQPKFSLTKDQLYMFKGTEYENDPLAAKQSILARILSGDPSAGEPTLDQTLEAQKIQEQVMKLRKK